MKCGEHKTIAFTLDVAYKRGGKSNTCGDHPNHGSGYVCLPPPTDETGASDVTVKYNNVIVPLAPAFDCAQTSYSGKGSMEISCVEDPASSNKEGCTPEITFGKNGKVNFSPSPTTTGPLAPTYSICKAPQCQDRTIVINPKKGAPSEKGQELFCWTGKASVTAGIKQALPRLTITCYNPNKK
ncbi:MAG: hypothetical protein HY075_14625 [Deltaproteobacteria bacterium]|nr:hypothetical protein [Deltaproteobacteria bacterium]